VHGVQNVKLRYDGVCVDILQYNCRLHLKIYKLSVPNTVCVCHSCWYCHNAGINEVINSTAERCKWEWRY
jgi:hypothetical protein